MERKHCPMCNKDLPLSSFSKNKSRKDGLQTYCVECTKERYQKIYKDKATETRKIYRQEHKEEISRYNKQYRLDHLDEINKRAKSYREENKDLLKEQKRKSREKHKDHIYAHQKEYNKYRMENDEMYRFKMKIRNFINKCFKRKGYTKNNHTENIVGCSAEELKKHLYDTFEKNYGYKYDGKEKVHIDHITPLSTAKNENDVIKLCNYKNLQLLKAKDNLEKSNKLDFELPKYPKQQE